MGVVFEEYDMPGIKMVNSIATGGGAKTAWFKDKRGKHTGRQSADLGPPRPRRAELSGFRQVVGTWATEPEPA